MPDRTPRQPAARHDLDRLPALVAQVPSDARPVRIGAMFGCPAAFVGRRMAFCVYGDVVGIRLPRKDAAELLAAGTAAAFRPFGRPAMAEWIELPGGTPAAVMVPILVRAIRYAQDDAAAGR